MVRQAFWPGLGHYLNPRSSSSVFREKSSWFFSGMHCKNELFVLFIPAGDLHVCTLAFQVQIVSILSVRFTMTSGDRATFMVIVPVQVTPLPGQVVFSSEKYLFAIISK